MACPICVTPEGSAIGDGMRAGAAVLIVAAVIIIGLVTRFAYRLWSMETAAQNAGGAAATAGSQNAEGIGA